MSSVYPGPIPRPLWDAFCLGTMYGFVDGAIAGGIFGLLYRAFRAAPATASARSNNWITALDGLAHSSAS